jgi:uncharacterized protein involved in exopolysaccharide biosynthesis
MEEQTLEFTDYIRALRQRRLSIILIALAIFSVGAATAFLWPPTYKSAATILIKEQDIPPDLVRSTVTSYAAQRIQTISQRVMARPNLLEIIEKYKLYADQRERLTTEEIISEMRNNISLNLIDADVVDPRTGRPTAATIAFSLSFSGEHPAQVQKVANELMSLYLKENLKERSEKASETLAFLSDESNRLSREIATIEKNLAEFKEQHGNSLPELSQLNLQMMERTDREIADVVSTIRVQEERKIFLESQLAQLKPYGADVALDPATRLQALRTEYLRLVARYSSDHPDVVRIKREIAGLEQETGQVDSSAQRLKQLDELHSELARLRESYSSEHPDVIRVRRQIESLENAPAPTSNVRSSLASNASDNPDNPAYIQLRSQIETADAEIRGLKNKKTKLEAKLADYERRLVATPQVERQYKVLQRDLQNAVGKYQEVRAKQMEAEIAQELEKDSKGERFEIVEPPILPEEPVSPNRPAILILSLVLALGCGIGYAAIAESLDDSIRGSKLLFQASGAAPLAVIPYLENDAESSKRKRRTTGRVAAAVGVIILSIVMLHYFWTPLDVLWYKALRKADVVINT